MDYLSPLSTDRPKLGHLGSGGPGSPMRERMGNFVGRRRDSTGEYPTVYYHILRQFNFDDAKTNPLCLCLENSRYLRSKHRCNHLAMLLCLHLGRGSGRRDLMAAF